ncbi:MAG: hypothetical protein E7573_04555 [Ruminococcaceae bacterium]|nr:hypothetical protein [Oscillospiraceae bacterium]
MLKFNVMSNINNIEIELESSEIKALFDLVEAQKKSCSVDKKEHYETIYNKVKALYLFDKQPDEASILQIQHILLPSNEITKNNVNNIKIKDLPFSKRTFNCLNRANIKILGDLLCYSKDDLLKIRNLGIQSLVEIVDVLKRFDLELSKFKN